MACDVRISGHRQIAHRCRPTTRMALVLGVLLVFRLTVSLAAQEREPGIDWARDIAALTAEIESRHPDPFHAITRVAFLERAEAVAALGAARRREAEIVLELARLLATLEETHSYLAWPDGDDRVPFRRFGFTAERFEDGVFITHTDETHRSLIGSRVLAFGDRRIEEVLTDVASATGADSSWTYHAIVPWRLPIAELMAALGATEPDGTLRITATSREGAPVTGTFLAADEALPFEDLREASAVSSSLYWRTPEVPYWLDWLEVNEALYLQVNQIADAADESLLDFTAHVGQAIRQRNPKRVLVDLRRNLGGNSRLARPLVRELVSTEAATREGGLVVLIGPSTISAAVVFAEELAHFGRVLFVGEPTGSNRNQWGDNVRFELPTSGLEISVATAFYQTGGPYAPEGPILPDLFVPLLSADYFAVRDPALKAALAYAPPPSLAEIYERASESGEDPADALAHFVDDPKRRFQDFERELRLLAREIANEGHASRALRVCDLLVRRHPERARSYMAKAEQLAALDRNEEALTLWQTARQHIDNDPSLYPELARRLRGLADQRVAELMKDAAP